MLAERLAAIEGQFREAFSIVSRLPDPRPKGYRAAWPEVPPTGEGEPRKLRLKPDPNDVDPAVEIVVRWPRFVRREAPRKVLLSRGAGMSYRRIAEEVFGRKCSRETVRKWREEALLDIKHRLACEAKNTLDKNAIEARL